MAFKLENIWVALFCFGLVMAFGFGFYGINLSVYNVDGSNSSLGKVSNQLKNSYDTGLTGKDKIQGGSVSESNAVDNMVKAGYTTARSGPFTTATMLLNTSRIILQESNVYDEDVLPIYKTAVALMTILTIFAVVYLIMRFRSG